MEANLKQRVLNRFRKTYSTVLTGESMGEAVVSDVMPDMDRILRTTGTVLLRGKTTEEGRVSLSAEIAASVLCIAEGEGRVFSLPVSIPFSAETESPEIGEESRTAVALRLTAIDAQMRNPRKVSVKANVEARVECYSPISLTLTENVDIPADAAIHIRKETFSLSSVTDLKEKTFSVVESFALPSERGAFRSLLESGFTASVDEVRVQGEKLVIKGTAAARLLCDVESELSPVELDFSSPFSHILDLDSDGENAANVLLLMPTAAFFEPAKGELQDRINMELHFVLQAISWGTEQVEAVSDVYSNRFLCETEREELNQHLVSGRQTLRETARGILEAPGGVRDIVSARAVISDAELSNDHIAVMVAANVLYRDEEDDLQNVHGPVRVDLEIGAGEGIRTELIELRLGSLFVSAAADGIELRVPVEAELLQFVPCSAEQLTAVLLSEETQQMQGPSLTLVPREENVDLWALAKQCASTVELIENANPAGEEEQNLMLLIPRETVYG